MYRSIQKLTLVLLLAVNANAAWCGEWHFENASRVVAISDVHGAYAAMVRTLQNADVIDQDLHWSGADSHLVIVGDLLDRGPNSRDAMDLLMRLEGEAQARGGRVHVLIGNHEAMNLVGDLRYVSRQEYAAFAMEESAEERERWFAAWAVRARTGEQDPAVLRAKFDEDYPPGFFAHRRAFASDGEYGKWLLSKPVIVVVNGTAFVHGGLSPMIAEYGLDGVNGKLRAELREYLQQLQVLFESGDLLPTDSFYDHERLLSGFIPAIDTPEHVSAAVAAVRRLGESDLHSRDGPLWYRGNVACSRVIEEDRLAASLDKIGANRVVIGHTPTQGRQVMQRFGGRVIEVDTGMLNNYYDGRGHALVLQDDRVSVISEESREVLTVAEHPRRVGARPGGELSATDLEHLLATGDILSRQLDGAQRDIVEVSNGQLTVQALFANREGRGFYADVAAYRLDRLLELDMVPVAVVRTIDGDDGSLQFLPHNWIDEAQRGAAGRGSSAQCPLNEQWRALYVFDSLIYNEGRSLAQMLYSPDRWQLVLVGHQHAFATRRGKPRHLEPVPLTIGAAWKAALEALNEDVLDAQLGDVLDSRRRRALLRRRDELLEETG